VRRPRPPINMPDAFRHWRPAVLLLLGASLEGVGRRDLGPDHHYELTSLGQRVTSVRHGFV